MASHPVAPAIFSCVKTETQQQHGTNYVPKDANKGTATSSTPMYSVVLDFDFNPASGDLTYTLIGKSWIVPISEVWSGIGDTTNTCRST
jgi:hypothetical protein